MIEAIKFWNEPNNLSHWDFQLDEGWRDFAAMTRHAAAAVRARYPDLTQVLGGYEKMGLYLCDGLSSHFAKMLREEIAAQC